MRLRTIMGLVLAAAVALWFVDAWHEGWSVRVALLIALIIPPRLAWSTVRWVNAPVPCMSRGGSEAGADRAFLFPLMILFLIVYYGFAAIALGGLLILSYGFTPD